MGDTGANKKVANGLVALSSAAVLAVYSAGYQRTQAAAERFERLAASRRHAMPAPAPAGTVAPMPVPFSDSAPGAAPERTRTVAPGTGGVPPGLPPAPQGAPASAPASAAPVAVTSGASSGTTPVQAAARDAAAPAAGPDVAPVAASPAPSPVAQPQLAENAAPAEMAPITPPPSGRFKDGTYQGRGSCIHGDIQAQVVVKNGRITEATISSCETRYSCDWLDPILSQVAARQSAFVDYVSGATDSTDAFSAAVTDALLKAQ